MANPQIVTNSIIDTNADKINSSDAVIQIHPISITRYAWFEKLNSPFLDTSIKFEVNSIIPSAYVVCSSNQTLKKYSSKDTEKLISDAFDWADQSLKLSDIPELINCVLLELKKINQAAPEQVQTSGTEESHDGSKKN